MKDSFNIYLKIQQPRLFLLLNFLNCKFLASSRNVNAQFFVLPTVSQISNLLLLES